MKCAICKKDRSSTLLTLACGNLDGSSLYDPAIIECCCECGHVFNRLNKSEMDGMLNYYANEYSMNNLHSPNKKGDMPGSCSSNSMVRYSSLWDTIKYYIHVDSQILDIGCAAGGLLNALDHRGYSGLHGIDISEPYVKLAAKNKRLNIRPGSAENVPYSNDKFDLVVADQVVEHLFDPNQIFIEARRVLKPGGYFCIGVPDAMQYGKCFFFDFYWFLMREHIQHFDIEHLSTLARNHGFELMVNITTFSNMISEKSLLPNLIAMFRLNDKRTVCSPILHRSFNLRYQIKNYISYSRKELEKKARTIDIIKDSGVPIYVFGMSREFYYLYNNTNLRHCNIIGLIDDTEYKQEHFTFDGMKIKPRSELIGSENCVLITATAHTETIKGILYSIGHKGKAIEI